MFLKSSLMIAGTALAISACAAPQTYQAVMTSAQEVPSNLSRGVGTAQAVVYPTTRAMTLTGDYKDLTGAATAAHIHGPALPGANAPIVIPIVPPTSPLKASATLTEQQLADLQAGKYYVNVHTAANPGGEIRGQLQRVQ